MTVDIKALNALLDEVQPTVGRANDQSVDTDVVVKSVGDDFQNPYGAGMNHLSADDSLYLQRRFNTLSMEEKGWILRKQLEAGAGKGVPLTGYHQGLYDSASPEVRKALDTSGGAALIRQDLDPIIVSIF